MADLSLDDAKEAKDEARSGQLRDNDAGIPESQSVDYENSTVHSVRLSPDVMVAFSHIARINIQTYGNDEPLLDLEQNLEGAGMYGYDLELTLADPQIIDGEVWVEKDPDDEDYAEYRIVGDPESEDNPYEVRETVHWEDQSAGEVDYVETDGLGQLPGGNSWDAEKVEAFDPDYIEVTISSSRAMDILGVLDTAGKYFRNQDGEVVEGLFEIPPGFFDDEYDYDEGASPRLVGYPELRADMVGQQGAITCLFDPDEDDPSTRTAIDVDLHKVVEDSDGTPLETLTPLTPDNDAYALPEYPRGSKLYWDDDTDPVGADAEPETDDGVAAAQAAMEDGAGSAGGTSGNGGSVHGADDDDSGSGYDDLSDDGQDFVDDAVNVLEMKNLDSVSDLEDMDDFRERVQTADGDIQADPEVVATIIDARA